MAPRISYTQNLVERIASKFSVGTESVVSGDFISIAPKHVMTHDNTGAVLLKFGAIGASKIHQRSQPVFTLDHDVQNKTDKNLKKYATIEAFAKKHGIDFYPAGAGIGHQIMVEQGYAFPLSMAVASDSHSNMYGGVGCLGTPIVRTDAAAIWATGRTWWQVPPVANVQLVNSLPRGVTGKDIIVALCGLLNNDEVLNHAIEFSGPGVGSMSVDERLTVANMTTEWGALAGVFPVDSKTLEYVYQRARTVGSTNLRFSDMAIAGLEKEVAQLHEIERSPSYEPRYAKTIELDLATLSPHISGPNSVKVVTPVSVLAAQRIPIQKAYLLSCTNARQSDIHDAAEIFRASPEKKIAEGVEFYIAPASLEVQKDAVASGDWDILVDAGAKVLPAGCGPCIGLGVGLLQDGEVGISATNRNFKGRMGSRSAKAYLGSPAVVAASAISGYITAPPTFDSHTEKTVKYTVTADASTNVSERNSDVRVSQSVEGFPACHQGEIVFCGANNLDTDGIYPGAFTYQDDLKPAEMAKIAMRNYDPKFVSIIKENDILVSGFNFGTGSSREQAATCLLFAGIKLIIAGSLSETYKRNAINNGLLCLESPKLVEDLIATFGMAGNGNSQTVRTGWSCDVDFLRGRVTITKGAGQKSSYNVPVVGSAAQELIVLGGLENWVKSKI